MSDLSRENEELIKENTLLKQKIRKLEIGSKAKARRGGAKGKRGKTGGHSCGNQLRNIGYVTNEGEDRDGMVSSRFSVTELTGNRKHVLDEEILTLAEMERRYTLRLLEGIGGGNRRAFLPCAHRAQALRIVREDTWSLLTVA